MIVSELQIFVPWAQPLSDHWEAKDLCNAFCSKKIKDILGLKNVETQKRKIK